MALSAQVPAHPSTACSQVLWSNAGEGGQRRDVQGGCSAKAGSRAL